MLFSALATEVIGIGFILPRSDTKEPEGEVASAWEARESDVCGAPFPGEI
jgi:hypothetical protein